MDQFSNLLCRQKTLDSRKSTYRYVYHFCGSSHASYHNFLCLQVRHLVILERKSGLAYPNNYVDMSFMDGPNFKNNKSSFLYVASLLLYSELEHQARVLKEAFCSYIYLG